MVHMWERILYIHGLHPTQVRYVDLPQQWSSFEQFDLYNLQRQQCRIFVRFLFFYFAKYCVCLYSEALSVVSKRFSIQVIYNSISTVRREREGIMHSNILFLNS